MKPQIESARRLVAGAAATESLRARSASGRATAGPSVRHRVMAWSMRMTAASALPVVSASRSASSKAPAARSPAPRAAWARPSIRCASIRCDGEASGWASTCSQDPLASDIRPLASRASASPSSSAGEAALPASRAAEERYRPALSTAPDARAACAVRSSTATARASPAGSAAMTCSAASVSRPAASRTANARACSCPRTGAARSAYRAWRKSGWANSTVMPASALTSPLASSASSALAWARGSSCAICAAWSGRNLVPSTLAAWAQRSVSSASPAKRASSSSSASRAAPAPMTSARSPSRGICSPRLRASATCSSSSGLPAQACQAARAVASSTGRPDRAASSAADPSSVSGASSSTKALCPWASPLAACWASGGQGRSVPTTATGSCSILRHRKWNRPSESRSLQCRSSSAKTSGSAARPSSQRCTPKKHAARMSAAGLPAWAAVSGARASPPPRAAMACDISPNGRDCSMASPRPTPTLKPSAARPQACSSSAVLPSPGSPTRKRQPPRPARARSSSRPIAVMASSRSSSAGTGDLSAGRISGTRASPGTSGAGFR